MHPAEGLDSPAQTSFSRDGLADTDVRTLDYLGLAETPVQTQATLAQPTLSSLNAPPFRYDLLGLNKNMNRFRSYSVNAKEKYAEDDEDYLADGHYSGQHSGVMTPVDAALAQTQYQIQQHNLAVQAYANQATASRPRARTAGVLDSPGRPSGRSFLPTPTSLNSTITAADLGLTNGLNYATLPDALQAMQLNGLGGRSGLDMADENSQDVPTRALWLGNIPTSTTSTSLEMIFRNFGEIQSARVLVHKNCGFVNFETIESAMKARSILHGKEIFPGSGPVRIGYAKVPSSSATDTPDNTGTKASSSPDPFESSQGETRELSGNDKVDGALTANSMHAQSNAAAALHVPDLPDLRDDILHIVREFGATDREQYQIEENIDAAIGFDNFASEIAPVPEPSHNRVHDAPRLREIRKRIDNNTISALEIEEIAVGMLPEIVELSSDYLGNTVVQKLFEYCSEDIKHQMLAQIDPHLAEIGVHKNGTWACQKIIDVSKVPSQMGTVVNSLRPYTVPLFLDQYGNYVLQCCLRFGFPWNNFIFETMLSRMWDIAQGRFGSRAMRACLESHHATKDQQRMLAAAIALHSVQLATNQNGALLLTWYLDTCNFPCRRVVLAPRLVPHLVHLCTHKVAYLTVLKVINQRSEPEARDTVLKALFFSENDKTLEDILSDHAYGATLIFKILTTPCFDEGLRAEVVRNVRNVLCRIKASPSQGYKRLMDEVGLPARTGKGERESHTPNGHHTPHQERHRSTSQHGSNSGRRHQQDMERQYSGQYHQSPHHQQYPMQNASPVTSAVDHNGISAYDQFSPSFSPSAINNQYQQMLLRGVGPTDVYNGMTGAGLGGFPAVAPPHDLRGMPQNPFMTQPAARPLPMNANPLMQQPGFAPPSYNPLVASYQYQMPYLPQQQPMMQAQNGGRRGRVSSVPNDKYIETDNFSAVMVSLMPN